MTHRRAGKTVACVHDLQKRRNAMPTGAAALRLPVAVPRQSKAVAWDYLRAAMAPLRATARPCTRASCGSIIPNGGQVRLYGADNPDALRGIYLDGIVLDEYADMDPRVWSEIIRPALADRQGWAVFIGTPKGRNAFFELWRRAQSGGGLVLPDAQGERHRAHSRRASSRSRGAISPRSNTRRSSNARSTPR